MRQPPDVRTGKQTTTKKGLVVLIKLTPILIVTYGLIFRCLKCKHVVRKVVVSQIQHVLSKYIGIRIIFCVY